MSKYIGEITVHDFDDYRFPHSWNILRFSVYRSGSGGQSYQLTWYFDLEQWRIRNVNSGHTILPNGEIGRALISACEERLAKEI